MFKVEYTFNNENGYLFIGSKVTDEEVEIKLNHMRNNGFIINNYYKVDNMN